MKIDQEMTQETEDKKVERKVGEWKIARKQAAVFFIQIQFVHPKFTGCKRTGCFNELVQQRTTGTVSFRTFHPSGVLRAYLLSIRTRTLPLATTYLSLVFIDLPFLEILDKWNH